MLSGTPGYLRWYQNEEILINNNSFPRVGVEPTTVALQFHPCARSQVKYAQQFTKSNSWAHRAHAHAGAGAAERERGGHAVVAGGRARGRARRAHAVPHAAEHHAQQAAVLCE